MNILWSDLAKARRDLVDSKALDSAPFLSRLWYLHLFWIRSSSRARHEYVSRGSFASPPSITAG